MTFTRSTVRYSMTPIPETPYQAAQQVWDARLGSARVQAANWRLMAFGLLGVAVIALSGVIWLSARSTVKPWIVEVDRDGAARAVAPATENYHPSDAQIAYHLEHFIKNVRAIPLDPIILREQWLQAYDYATDKAAMTLSDYARVNNPFSHVGHVSVAVEVSSVVRASPSSFQVRWLERHYSDGALTSTEHWTAILSIVVTPPTDALRLRKNPLGIYVDTIDWSRELEAH
jgi:type IV secretory pathway TrbF-like protein